MAISVGPAAGAATPPPLVREGKYRNLNKLEDFSAAARELMYVAERNGFIARAISRVHRGK